MKARILSALFLAQFSALFGVVLGYTIWAPGSATSLVPVLMLPALVFAGLAFAATVED